MTEPMQVNTRASLRCTAHNRDGSPCGAWAIHGGRVCGMHGGRAPQVKMAAQERINALVHPALNRIERTIDDDNNPHLALVASRDILDRAGYKATEKIQSDGRTVIEIEYVARSLELPERSE